MEVEKFTDRYYTAKGEERGFVPFTSFKNLWFNTGTLCNLACTNCYIESSPKNDRLSYITLNDVTPYLEEIKKNKWKVETIGFTGGEPFLNPSIIEILEVCLRHDLKVQVLTNAHKVLKRWEKKLLFLKEIYQDKLRLRISLDHYSEKIHEQERGLGTFAPTLKSVKWLFDQGFSISIAGRILQDETHQQSIEGYQKMLESFDIALPINEQTLVVFPEMQTQKETPEITNKCWDILNVDSQSIMCSSERMIVKKKEASAPQVQACTLLAYEEEFNLGTTLEESQKKVYLNHSFCSQFCVLGGASCSST